MPRTRSPALAGSKRGTIERAQFVSLHSRADAGQIERNAFLARCALVGVAALVALGFAARARQYLGSPSFWYDEAYLVVNIIDRSYAELIGPLRQCVVIPPLFLWSLRYLYEHFGPSEWAMRLPAFVAGAVALGLMIPLARAAVAGWWWILPVALAATSRHLIMHSYEVRPYTFDLLASASILLSAWVCLAASDSPPRRRLGRACLLALALAGPWVSFPSPFVLAGACAALYYEAHHRQRTGRRFAVGLGLVVLLSAAALWWAQARHMYYPGLKEHWTELGGFPPSPAVPAMLAWTWQCLAGIGQYATTGMGVPLAVLSAVGLAALCKTRRAAAILLATPVVCAMLAALAGKYPMVDRTVLFAAPCVWLLAAEGLYALSLRLGRGRWAWVSTALAAVLVGPGVPRTAELVFAVNPRVDFRGAFNLVRREGMPEDLCWVSHPEVHEVYFGKGETDRISYATVPAVVEEARSRRLWVVAPPAHPVKTYPWSELRECLRLAGIPATLHGSCYGLEIDRYDPPAPPK